MTRFVLALASLVPVLATLGACAASPERTAETADTAERPEGAAPRCAVCGAVIHGRHALLAQRLAYHESCLARTLRCEGCGLPAAGDRGPAARLADGRVACRPCRLEAVGDAIGARQACLRARDDLRSTLGLDIGAVETPVLLVSRQELLARAGPLAHPALKALTEVEERAPLAGARSERQYRVFVLYGLPRAGLVGILAHELFHVLQSEASPASQEPALREGAANYVQVRVLRAGGDELRARLLEEDQDPVYGDGLRRVERLARERGERATLEAGLQATSFPAGY